MATFVLDPNTDTIASVPRMMRQFVKKQYRDKQFKGGETEWKKRLDKSTTVYVGNLSCYTNEYQLYELFTRCGSIRRIIMGLDKIKKTPCGFCFVEFDERDSALKSVNFLNRTHLDGREVQVDIDGGFEDGRQYGRGAHGGQIGDERRREREQGAGPQRGGAAPGPILTRSITVVACIAMISIMLIAYQPQPVTSDIVLRPFGKGSFLDKSSKFSKFDLLLEPSAIRGKQASPQREAYELAFAQFLTNMMKQAKPSLLKAFIKQTLADNELKEIAFKIFLGTDTNSTET